MATESDGCALVIPQRWLRAEPILEAVFGGLNLEMVGSHPQVKFRGEQPVCEAIFARVVDIQEYNVGLIGVVGQILKLDIQWHRQQCLCFQGTPVGATKGTFVFFSTRDRCLRRLIRWVRSALGMGILLANRRSLAG